MYLLFGRCLCVGVLSGSLIVGAALGREHESAQQILQEALQFQNAGNLEEAISHYEELLQVASPTPSILSNLGVAYAGSGAYEKAIDAYRRALQFETVPAGVHFNLGLAYYKAAHYADSLEQFEIAVRQSPRDERVLILAADVNFRLGRYQEVIATLDPVRLSSQNPALLYLLGTSLIREGRTDEGAVYIERIMRLGDTAAVHMMTGLIRMMAGEMDAAISQILEAIGHNPNLPGVHSMLGRAYLSIDEAEKAKMSFHQELQFNPTDFDAHFYLGSLYQNDKQYDKALDMYQSARILRPNDSSVTYRIAVTQLLRGALEEARQLLEELVAKQPDYLEAHVSLATVYHRLGLKEEAARERQIIIQLNADDDPNRPQERRSIYGSSVGPSSD